MSRVEMCRKALNLGRKHELERIWRAEVRNKTINVAYLRHANEFQT